MPTYGSVTFTGAGNALLVRAGRGYDGSSGGTWEEQYEGTEAGIDAKFAEVIALGGRARKSSEGGSFSLTVTYARDPDDVSTEVPVDEWENDTETAEVDLFAWAPAITEAIDFGNIANYRKLIIEAVDNGEALPSSLSSYAVADYIYKLLTRNVTSIPLNRPTLSRNRTFSAAYAGRDQMTARQTIWTTTSLVAAWDIPEVVAARLPDDPPSSETPYGTTWGWRLSVDRSSYNISAGKVTEQKSWQFAAWVTSFFNVE